MNHVCNPSFVPIHMTPRLSCSMTQMELCERFSFRPGTVALDQAWSIPDEVKKRSDRSMEAMCFILANLPVLSKIQ